MSDDGNGCVLRAGSSPFIKLLIRENATEMCDCCDSSDGFPGRCGHFKDAVSTGIEPGKEALALVPPQRHHQYRVLERIDQLLVIQRFVLIQRVL